METLSLAAARRVALAAQGFADPRPAGGIDRRHLNRVLQRTGLLQIDSVSAVVRAHYMPLYSRLGPYPMQLLDEAASGRRRMLFEYWAHEASFLPLSTWPLLRWRMKRAENHDGIYTGLGSFARERADYVEAIFRRIAEDGPLPASTLEGQKGSGGWWGWSEAKKAVEWLFWAGRITAASRRGFERLYDLPERVLPADIYNHPEIAPADAHRELLRISARAHGVATAMCLRDYFRLAPKDMAGRLEELVEDGELIPVRVEGWNRQAYLHRDARLPRKINARALLAPFDPLVFERDRTENLFNFRYRLEIYTPAEKRQYGYYVMPFLLGDRIVARVDLRADRNASVLRLHAAYAETLAPAETVEQLLAELHQMRGWLGLERLEIEAKGDLGPALVAQATSGSAG